MPAPRSFAGIMGFAAGSTLHTDRFLELSVDMPIVIECIETEEKIEAILPELGRHARRRVAHAGARDGHHVPCGCATGAPHGKLADYRDRRPPA